MYNTSVASLKVQRNRQRSTRHIFLRLNSKNVKSQQLVIFLNTHDDDDDDGGDDDEDVTADLYKLTPSGWI